MNAALAAGVERSGVLVLTGEPPRDIDALHAGRVVVLVDVADAGEAARGGAVLDGGG